VSVFLHATIACMLIIRRVTNRQDMSARCVIYDTRGMSADVYTITRHMLKALQQTRKKEKNRQVRLVFVRQDNNLNGLHLEIIALFHFFSISVDR